MNGAIQKIIAPQSPTSAVDPTTNQSEQSASDLSTSNSDS